MENQELVGFSCRWLLVMPVVAFGGGSVVAM